MIINLIGTCCISLYLDLISFCRLKLVKDHQVPPCRTAPKYPPLFTCILDVTDMGSIPKEKFFDFFFRNLTLFQINLILTGLYGHIKLNLP